MKTAESRQCPDATTILSAAQALFPQKNLTLALEPSRALLNVEVTIRHTSEGYESILSARGAHQGQRRIVDPDADCQGLAHALAVALVMLMEPSNETSATRTERVPQLAWPVTTREVPRRRLTQVGLETGAMAAVGLLGGESGNPGSFGAYVGFGYSRTTGPGIRLRAIGLRSLPTHYGPGKVRVDLVAAMPALCWRFGNANHWSLDTCWDLGVGRQHGEGSGYARYEDTNEQARLWLTTGPSLTFSYALIGVLNAAITTAMGARLYEQSFSIKDTDKVLPVQTQQKVGEYLGLGLTALWPPAVEPTGR